MGGLRGFHDGCFVQKSWEGGAVFWEFQSGVIRGRGATVFLKLSKIMKNSWKGPLRIENDIEKAKEDIGSKGFMKRSQKAKNKAPCARTTPSCVRTVPWEHLGRVFVKHVRSHTPLVCPHESETKVDIFIDRVSARPTRVSAWSRLAEIK
ncbi:hypothetical protein PIB30_058586 [Stylosanthes scabra]|uniref:Uncharacterized protein n=1 Tax=Stylosanthes scabra TaxID=79078 RepID=A0ABU6TJS7_9FABA|nr:hypothetical protein [Stylosanthes scabra]